MRWILLSISVILIGCGVDKSPPELPNIEYKLVITDSIRVEIGDPDYIFGRPICMTHSPDGNIAFLDRIKHMAFMYTPEGEFIRSIGREGSGTGEFNLPSSMAFYSNGDLLIGDMDAITLFDSNYEFMNRMTWPSSTPYLVSALDGGGFIAMKTVFILEDENTFITSLALWDDGDEDPSVEYFSIENEYVFETVEIDFSRNRESTIYCCATLDGRVFYSRSSIDDFEIHGCEPDGTHFLLIEDENFSRVSKTEQELQAEMDYYTNITRMMTAGSQIDIPIELDPFKRIVLGMFIDGFERLWVRLGSFPGIVFRVYDFSGEILFHAMVDYPGNPLDLISWKITGDEHGFLGYDTSHDQYQRIYILTLIEAE